MAVDWHASVYGSRTGGAGDRYGDLVDVDDETEGVVYGHPRGDAPNAGSIGAAAGSVGYGNIPVSTAKLKRRGKAMYFRAYEILSGHR